MARLDWSKVNIPDYLGWEWKYGPRDVDIGWKPEYSPKKVLKKKIKKHENKKKIRPSKRSRRYKRLISNQVSILIEVTRTLDGEERNFLENRIKKYADMMR
jgi:hypothetical protein